MNYSSSLRRIRSYLGQSLIRNGIYILGVNVFPGLVGFLFWKIASLFFTPTEIGLGAAFLSVSALLSNLAGLGLGIGLVRFIPASHHPKRLINSSLSFGLLTSTLISLFFIWGIHIWSPDLIILRDRFLYLAGFLLLVVFTTLGTILRGVYVARRQSRYAFTYTALLNFLRLPALLLALGLGSMGVLVSHTLAYGIALLYSLHFQLPKTIGHYHFQPAIERLFLRNLIPYSMGVFIANTLFQSYQTVLPILVLNILSPEANGYAYISLMLGGFVISPGVALAYSAFSEGINNPLIVGSSFRKATYTSIGVTIIGAGLLLICSPWLLSIFGSDYVQKATDLLRWVSIATVFMVLNHIYFNQLRLYNRVIELVSLNLFLAILTIGGTVALLPLLGIKAIGIVLFIGNFFVVLLTARRLSKWLMD